MYVRVHVYPKSKKEFLEIVGENRYDIGVRERAERNLANERVREMIAEHYQVSVGQVRIVSGHHGQRKILSITKS
jgi:uncharacterized protein YggU (UPF0235/DUF167 family)